MARDFSKNTSNTLSLGLNAIGPLIHGSSVISAFCWFYADTLSTDAATRNNLFNVATNNLSGVKVNVNGLATPDVIRVGGRSQAADSLQTVTGTTEILTGAWYSVGGVLDFANDLIKVYVNGTLDNSGSVTFGSSTYAHAANTTLDDLIGCGNEVAIADERWDGAIAELPIWTVELTANEFASLHNKTNPSRIRPQSQIAYWPLWGDHSPEIELRNNKIATISGTVAKRDHAPVGLFSRRVSYVDIAAVTTLSISGAITPLGNLIKQPQTIYAGSQPLAGSIIKSILTAYTGQMTPAGEPDLGVQTTLSGSITPSGTLSLIKSILLSLSGTIASAGNLIKSVLTAYTGQIGPSGEPDMSVQTTLSGSITPSGALSLIRIFLLSLSGTIASAGNLIKGVLTAYTGQVGPNGNPNLGVQTSLSGNIAPSGNLILVQVVTALFEVLFKGMFRGMFRRMR